MHRRRPAPSLAVASRPARVSKTCPSVSMSFRAVGSLPPYRATRDTPSGQTQIRKPGNRCREFLTRTNRRDQSNLISRTTRPALGAASYLECCVGVASDHSSRRAIRGRSGQDPKPRFMISGVLVPPHATFGLICSALQASASERIVFGAELGSSRMSSRSRPAHRRPSKH
jgi:hypothetical protein